jgi:hypothetical protein
MDSKFRTFKVQNETLIAKCVVDVNMFDDPYVEAGTRVLEFLYYLKCVKEIDYWNFQDVSIIKTLCSNYGISYTFFVSNNKIQKKYSSKFLCINAGLWDFVKIFDMIEKI